MEFYGRGPDDIGDLPQLLNGLLDPPDTEGGKKKQQRGKPFGFNGPTTSIKRKEKLFFYKKKNHPELNSF